MKATAPAVGGRILRPVEFPQVSVLAASSSGRGRGSRSAEVRTGKRQNSDGGPESPELQICGLASIFRPRMTSL